MAPKKILFEWPDLGKKAYALLADEDNPELCQDLWDALPFESIMNNAVVTDGSMYCWAPMLSYAPVHKKERIDLAPVGRIRYSQNTGNKIIIQYQDCNEDIYGAVLGMIQPEDIQTIQEIGKEARTAIFMTKAPLRVRISRVDDQSSSSSPHIVPEPSTCGAEAKALAEELIRLGVAASSTEPEEHKRVRTGQNSGMGSCGQYFSTWEFVYSLTRDLSMYTLYPITKLARNDMFSVRQLEQIYMEIDPTYTNLLGSYGFKTLRTLARRFRELIASHTLTKEEFRYILDAFVFYTNMLAQWTYFYYPWGIGCACFRFDEEHTKYIPQTE